MPVLLKTVLLLVVANVFMTFAWYAHLRNMGARPLVLAIFASWGVAFLEYCFQVPANRIGHVSSGGPFTAPQLKIVQEAVTLVVFGVFSIVVLKEKLRPNDLIACGLIFAGVVVAMVGRNQAA